MMFNKLTDAETERLDLLTEELGEVLQAIGKIKRHGYSSYNPRLPDTGSNRDQLEKELGDVLYIIYLMANNGDITDDSINIRARDKSLCIGKYLHHNEAIPIGGQ